MAGGQSISQYTQSISNPHTGRATSRHAPYHGWEPRGRPVRRSGEVEEEEVESLELAVYWRWRMFDNDPLFLKLQ
jgi:hypothetical protein